MNQDSQREQALAPLSRHSKSQPWDMLIIGGGITGAGIAREAVRRGLKVLLVEQKDFAWGTSSRSSKMVHGGLRYIASGDVKTTLHSVRERERMLNEAGGLVKEMHYIMPHYKGKFPPPWIFNNLLRVYDTLAGKRYHKYYKKDAFLRISPNLKSDKFLGASQFSDAVTDDSRLVMRVLEEAVHDGAHIINYLKAESLLTDEQGLVIGAKLVDTSTDYPISSGSSAPANDSGGHYDVYAKVVVSATGAWADQLRMEASQQSEATFRKQIRPSRGSHVVISRDRLPIDQAYTLLHPVDKRALFVFPWETRTVIGTTDLDNPPLDDQEVGITSAELDYLLLAANDLFDQAKLTREDVISTWAGVRPLISASSASDDNSDTAEAKRVSPSKEKRDHSVWLDHNLVTVSGGKLTTFRLIALDVLKICQPLLPQIQMPVTDDRVFSSPATIAEQQIAHPKFATLPTLLQQRLQGFYGRKLNDLLALAHEDDLTYIDGTNTIWAEIRFAAHFEQVIHLDDLLLRRTRLGLLLPQGAMTVPISSRLQQICQQELGWSEDKWQQEVQRYTQLWQRYYHLPTAI
ncbi:MAG: glycerol-3-phosphate dehydrogenase/oxidase [Psychrobacter sp.]|nr:glycerol-3-phosphate dehydrogenase/oxidase [Psychrobacter sp.]